MVPTEENLELALLVDHFTEEVLQNSRLESSTDGRFWVSLQIS